MKKLIEGYENYSISDSGVVTNEKTGKILKQSYTRGNYLKVVLYKDSKGLNKPVHRLVAEAFLPNPDNLSDVDHINGNKEDNTLSNLRWSSHKDNLNNPATRYKTAFRIKGVSITDGSVIEYSSIKEAQKLDGFNASHISACIRGIHKYHKGYYWYRIY